MSKPFEPASKFPDQTLPGRDGNQYISVKNPRTKRYGWQLLVDGSSELGSDKVLAQEGKKLGEGAFGRVSEVRGHPELVVKKLLDPKSLIDDLNLECQAMHRAHEAGLDIMPRCHESSRTRLVMQRLDGPDLTCEELSQHKAVQHRMIHIAEAAYTLGIDVGDFHVGNYLWHRGVLVRIDASVLTRPVLFPGRDLYRPLRLLSRNFTFYPLSFEEYLFTPACAEVIPRLWRAQLAAYYSFDPGMAQRLLVVRELNDRLLRKVKDAYKAVGLRPRQAPGSSGLRDKVFRQFSPEITALEKRLKKQDLVTPELAALESTLSDFQAHHLTPGENSDWTGLPPGFHKTLSLERNLSTGERWRAAPKIHSLRSLCV